MEVDVRAEVIRTEIIDQASALWRDFGRAQMFVPDCAALGLRRAGSLGCGDGGAVLANGDANWPRVLVRSAADIFADRLRRASLSTK